MIIPRYSKKKHQIKAFTGTSGCERRGEGLQNYKNAQLQ